LFRGLPADAAEAVALVPTDLRPALCHDARGFLAELRCHAAGFVKLPRLAKIELVERVLDVRHVQGKVGNIVLKTEEYWRDRHPERRNHRGAEPPEFKRRLGLDQDIEMVERQDAALWILGLGIEPDWIAALCIAAVKRVTGKNMWFHSRSSSVLMGIVGRQASIAHCSQPLGCGQAASRIDSIAPGVYRAAIDVLDD
jgi:hypothetical protein